MDFIDILATLLAYPQSDSDSLYLVALALLACGVVLQNWLHEDPPA